MLSHVLDYGYADSNADISQQKCLNAWSISMDSNKNHKTVLNFGLFGSSNGRKTGHFEIANGLIPDTINYFITESLSAVTFLSKERESETLLTMFASEQVLKKDWESPEEDTAWANL